MDRSGRACHRAGSRQTGHVLKPVLLAPIAAAILALAAAYGFSVARQSADMLLIQALHGSSAPVRAVARLSMRRFAGCPEADFAPTTAIGMLVSAWDEHVSVQGASELLRQLEALGCDINRHGAQGLTPLHSAVLFNNASAVHLLLRAGADPRLNTKIPRADGGYGEYDALAFAARVAAASDDNFDAVFAALQATPTNAPTRND